MSMYAPFWVARWTALALRRGTASLRELPCVYLIGAPKAGSTSLTSILWQHPAHVRPLVKELMYLQSLPCFESNWEFNRLNAFLWGRYSNGHAKYSLDGYRKFFPLKLTMRLHALRVGRSFTSDCSPFNLYCPTALRRIQGLSTSPRFVVSLRNPIERAYSDYRTHRTRGFEPRSFEQCIADEIEGREKRFRKRFLNQSIYEPHLTRWMDAFGGERIHIINAERFFADTKRVIANMFDFLELPGVDVSSLDLGPQNRTLPGAPMKATTREQLAEYFREPNRRLYQLVGTDWQWN